MRSILVVPQVRRTRTPTRSPCRSRVTSPKRLQRTVCATRKTGSLTEDPALLCLRRAVPAPDGLSGHARRTCQGLRAVCHRRRRFIAAGRARYARVRSTTNVANTMTMTGGISISIAAPMHAGCRATIQGRTPAGRGAQELRRGAQSSKNALDADRLCGSRKGPGRTAGKRHNRGRSCPPTGWALALDPTPTGQELSDQGKRLDCTAHAR